MDFCKTCDAEHGYPTNDYNRECEECEEYFNHVTKGPCPLALEIYDDDRECECTEAERFLCAMDI